MSFQSTVRQRVVYGDETVPGTPVTADQEIPDLKIELAADGESNQYAASGSIINSVVAASKEWAAGSFQGAMGYTTLGWVLDSLFGANTGGVWAPSATAVLVHKTYTMIRGVVGAAFQYAGVYVNGAGLHFGRDKCEVTNGTLMGQNETPGATFPASPTRLALRPVTPKTVSLYTADTFAHLASAGTKLAANSTDGTAIQVDLDWSELLGQVWALDDALDSYAGTVEKFPQMTYKFVVAAEVSGSDYQGPLTLAKYQTNQIVYMRIKATETIGAVTYLLTIDMAVQITKPPKSRDEDGLMVAEIECIPVIDPTTSKWIEITIVNS